MAAFLVSVTVSPKKCGMLHARPPARRPFTVAVVVALMCSFDFSAAVIERLRAEKESSERTRLDDGVEFRVRVSVCALPFFTASNNITRPQLYGSTAYTSQRNLVARSPSPRVFFCPHFAMELQNGDMGHWSVDVVVCLPDRELGDLGRRVNPPPYPDTTRRRRDGSNYLEKLCNYAQLFRQYCRSSFMRLFLTEKIAVACGALLQ